MEPTKLIAVTRQIVHELLDWLTARDVTNPMRHYVPASTPEMTGDERVARARAEHKVLADSMLTHEAEFQRSYAAEFQGRIRAVLREYKQIGVEVDEVFELKTQGWMDAYSAEAVMAGLSELAMTLELRSK